MPCELRVERPLGPRWPTWLLAEDLGKPSGQNVMILPGTQSVFVEFDDVGILLRRIHCRMVGRTDQVLSVLHCALLNEVVAERAPASSSPHSTVTDLARFLGLSISVPRANAA